MAAFNDIVESADRWRLCTTLSWSWCIKSVLVKAAS